MWGAIGGSIGRGTTSLLESAGSKITSIVGKQLVEDGVDMVVDLIQTASENDGLTGKDVLLSAVTSFGGDLVSAPKTNSTARNQIVDGVTDNKVVKNAVSDNVSKRKLIKPTLKQIQQQVKYILEEQVVMILPLKMLGIEIIIIT